MTRTANELKETQAVFFSEFFKNIQIKHALVNI